MNELDELYVQFLERGLLTIREAIACGDLGWARLAVELLHNVPSLLGEENIERHRYFWNQERGLYLERIAGQGSARAMERMQENYESIWEKMEPLMLRLFEGK
jgi:hypothetical protein